MSPLLIARPFSLGLRWLFASASPGGGVARPAAPAARAGVEPLGDAEHPLPEPWLDALAVVADPEQPALRVRPRADLDARGAVRGAVLDRVADQVLEQQFQVFLHPGDRGQL